MNQTGGVYHIIYAREKVLVGNMKRKMVEYPFFLAFLACLAVWLSAQIYQKSSALQLEYVREESDRFRALQLSEKVIHQLAALEKGASMTRGELMTVLLPGMGRGFTKVSKELTPGECVKWKRLLMKYNRKDYERLSGSYGAIWDDILCFPVICEDIAYENSWMFERNYGGRRGHEGCDLMPPENLSGHYQIVSMTDGVVENIGWLPQGGYRIGIRSPSGGYFYYAHLDSYARIFRPGESIEAGTVLGLMGDTGYGEEGTRGKFAVHLHLGIYIRTESTEELSVNPYWVLRYLQYREEMDEDG